MASKGLRTVRWASLLVPLRHIHTSVSICKSKNKSPEDYVDRQSRFMKKLMVGRKMAKKRVFSVDQPISKSFFDLNSSTQRGPSGTPQKSNKSLRRMEVFNVLFMEQITSLMSTGEASPDVLGLGLTISRVKIAPDFSGVNVYWVASGTTQEDVIEPILLKAAGRLRHELSQLRVMGIVPPIEFVKDRKFSKATEVEYLLSKCDFGEDFVPTPSHKFFAQTDSPKEESVIEEGTEEAELEPPQQLVPSTEIDLYKSVSMRQDILGVKHNLIMSQIKDMMKHIKLKKNTESDSEKIHSAEEFAESEFQSSNVKYSLTNTKEEVADAKKRQLEFFKYLKKTQITKSARIKLMSTAAKEKDFYDEEAYERWKRSVDLGLDELDNEDENQYEDGFYSNSKIS